jgi:hypothetical protein
MEQVQQVLRGDLTALERVASQIVQVINFVPIQDEQRNDTQRRQYTRISVSKITYIRKWRLLID